MGCPGYLLREKHSSYLHVYYPNPHRGGGGMSH